MGSIRAYETRAGTRYLVRYRKPDHSSTDKRGFLTKKDARLFLASVEVSQARGEYVDPTAARETVGALGAVWLGQNGHLKPSSSRPLEIAWRLYVEPKWGQVPVASVRHSDVQAWVTGICEGRSATTVRRVHGVLASILDVAVKDRRILTNPARGVNLPRKVTRSHPYLTHEQVSRLALGAGDRATIILVLAYCGIRWGELIGLRVRDLDMLRRRLNVAQNAVEVGDRIEVGTPKTHKRRSVPFPELLTEPLARACEGKGREDLVFGTGEDGFVRRSHSSRGWFGRAVRDAGLDPMTPHDLRHTAASLAVSSGASVKAVQRMLGHASAAMTLDVYADLFDDDLDAVAARMNQGLARTVVGEMWVQAASEAR